MRGQTKPRLPCLWPTNTTHTCPQTPQTHAHKHHKHHKHGTSPVTASRCEYQPYPVTSRPPLLLSGPALAHRRCAAHHTRRATTHTRRPTAEGLGHLARAPGRTSGSPARSLLPQRGTHTTGFKAWAGASVRRAPHKTRHNPQQTSLRQGGGAFGAHTWTGGKRWSGKRASSKSARWISVAFRESTFLKRKKKNLIQRVESINDRSSAG